MIALIPARAGSKRIPHKNTRLFCGQPLIAWTIQAAKDSGAFCRIYVCTDDYDTAQMALRHAVATYVRTPVSDDQPDAEWVTCVAHDCQCNLKTFAILRPTSPFRTAATIRRCFTAFNVSDGTHDSIRAVEPATQHPGKMWTWDGPGYPIRPLLEKKRDDGTPWHSSPTQSLPKYFVQNSSLEMGYTSNLEVYGTIHGRKAIPFFTEGHEGFSLDYPEDWDYGQWLVASGRATLAAPALAALSAVSPQK